MEPMVQLAQTTLRGRLSSLISLSLALAEAAETVVAHDQQNASNLGALTGNAERSRRWG